MERQKRDLEEVAPAFMDGMKWGITPHATAWSDKGTFSYEKTLDNRRGGPCPSEPSKY